MYELSAIADHIQKDWLTRLRRDLHRCPELALQEYRTAERIEEELTKFGVAHSRVDETGVLGILRGSLSGSAVVALRADIDALPILETNDADYRSQTPGVMHACGHDAHTACLLGAARALSEMRESFGGEIRFLFQPAEETGGGARDFVSSGALNDVQRVFGLHCAPDLPLGTVGLTPGLNNAAVDLFRIEIRGKSAHVSVPQQGADALYAASAVVVAIQSLVTRRTSPTEPVLIGIGKLTAGTAYNAVAEYAELEGTTRTVTPMTRSRVREQIDETAKEIAALSGAEAIIHWTDVTPALVNDPTVCREAKAVAEALGVHVITDRPLSLGGDNFAEYLNAVPGCYAYLGTANPARPETLNGLHCGSFELDEDALVTGAALYAGTALNWLSGSVEL